MRNEIVALRNAPKLFSLFEKTSSALSGSSAVSQFVKVCTTSLNATPTITAIASSMRLPRRTKFLKPLMDSPVECPRRACCADSRTLAAPDDAQVTGRAGGHHLIRAFARHGEDHQAARERARAAVGV